MNDRSKIKEMLGIIKKKNFYAKKTKKTHKNQVNKPLAVANIFDDIRNRRLGFVVFFLLLDRLHRVNDCQVAFAA